MCIYICIYIYIYIYLYIYKISEHKQNAKCTKQWKQNTAFKQLFETPCHKGVDWLHHRSYIGEHKTVSLANQFRAVAGAFPLLKTHQRY